MNSRRIFGLLKSQVKNTENKGLKIMHNLALFPEIIDFDTITQGIKYTGSKHKLIQHILEIAHKTGSKTVLDGFSGSTRVSQAFAKNGFRVISNDIAIWSKVFAHCYLDKHENIAIYRDIIKHLNFLPPKEGWFTEHYGGKENRGVSIQADGYKKPWQRKNTMKLDAIREEIDHLSLNETTKSVILTSLILALDKVDSTLGHYVSYLKDWSPRSYNVLELKLPALFTNEIDHIIFNKDIFEVSNSEKVDFAYFDPPYGSNNEKMPPSRVRYSSYYHIWKTVCLNDKPELFGKSNRRKDTSDTISSSLFEEFRKNEEGRFMAVDAIEQLIKKTTAHYILLSYSSGGRATSGQLRQLLEECGKVKKVIKLDYKKNVMANMKWTNDWLSSVEDPHQEFLFLLEKT